MDKEKNNNFISPDKKAQNFTFRKLTFNQIKNISTNKKIVKNIRNFDSNLNCKLTPMHNINLTNTKIYSYLKNSLLEEKLSNSNIKKISFTTTKCFTDELNPYCNDINKGKMLYSNYKIKKIKIGSKKSKSIFEKKNVNHNITLTKNSENKKFNKIYILNNHNFSKTTKKNNELSHSSKKKINNIIYILNKKCLMNLLKSRNNIKSNNNKDKIINLNFCFKSNNTKTNSNSFNCEPKTDIRTSCIDKSLNYNKYMNNSNISQKFSSKYRLSKRGQSSKDSKKKHNLIEDNKNNNSKNNNNIDKFRKLNSENNYSRDFIINSIKKKKNVKIINFLDLIKKKLVKNKNISNIVSKNRKNSENSKKPNKDIYLKRNYYTSRENERLKSKTNNNSNENSDIIKINNFKSCDISVLKLHNKKNKNKNNKILPIQLTIRNDILKNRYINYTPYQKESTNTINKNEVKNLGVAKNIKDYLNKRKNKNIIPKSYNFTEDDLYNNIFESNDINNKELINEIKINNFDVNKPNEQNMKYTMFKEFIEEENENESHLNETNISKIIIGEIDGYKDIIEKDKINNSLHTNKQKLPKNKNKKKVINKMKKENSNAPVNDLSSECEKVIINMINLEDDICNMSTNDFKHKKNKGQKDKTLKNYNVKNKTCANTESNTNKNKNFDKIKMNMYSLKKNSNVEKILNLNKLIVKKYVKTNNKINKESNKVCKNNTKNNAIFINTNNINNKKIINNEISKIKTMMNTP